MGYQEIVCRELSDTADVWSPEENGGNSTNVLKHLDAWMLSRSPDIVHMNCGLHDIKKEFGSVKATIPIEEYEENLRGIFVALKGASSIPVIWATTTPVNEKWHHRNKTFDRFEQDVIAYNEVSCRVATEFDIPVHDLYSVMMDAGPDQYLTPDGVHFTEEGSVLLGRAVSRCIRAYITKGQA